MSTDLTTHASGTLAEQMDYARAVSSGSLLPDTYRNQPANVLIAVGLGQSMGLSPAESLYRISIIKGKPTAGAELIAANVRKAGHKLRVRGDATSCTAQIIRADDPEYTFEVTRDMEWARQMGLANNDNYKKQPGTMLQWRAITAVARLACPEALYGVAYTADEMYDMDGGQPTHHPTTRPAQRARFDAAIQQADPAPTAPTPTDVTDAEVIEDAEPLRTEAQSRALFAALTEAGVTEREYVLAWLSELTGREIESTKTLTEAEASRAIDAARALIQPAEEVQA